MFIGEKIIYLELHKTACSHVLKLLQAIPSVAGTIVGKHNSVAAVPRQLLGDLATKFKLGNIRNPWDWYVSLWAFGCQGKGGLHGHLTRSAHVGILLRRLLLTGTLALDHPGHWKDVYADVDDPALFRRWLKMLFSPGYLPDVGEGFDSSLLSRFAGLLTYRYLNLFTRDFRKQRKDLRTAGQLTRYAETETLLDHVIRMEHLVPDFTAAMDRMGVPRSEVAAAIAAFPDRTNTSKHLPYKAYYDPESVDLVAQREFYLIDKFRYSF